MKVKNVLLCFLLYMQLSASLTALSPEINNSGDSVECTIGIASFGQIQFNTSISGNKEKPGVSWRTPENDSPPPANSVLAPTFFPIPGIDIVSKIPSFSDQANGASNNTPRSSWVFTGSSGRPGSSEVPFENNPTTMLSNLYKKWLGRDVNPDEVSSGLDLFTRSGITQAEIDAIFQNSTEYKVRQALLQAGIDNPARQGAAATAVDNGTIPRPGRDFNTEVVDFAQGRWP
ncbi:MAG: hypothetical protein HQM10_09360 [Candidatus Riflebacteria bacterium]|nr:hypothetical protein [Candidatus Riflebacteria bacterium]